jgi:hypothetical protein
VAGSGSADRRGGKCWSENTRFYGTVRLSTERFGRDINQLYQEVIQHLAAPDGVELEITVEIRAVSKTATPTPPPASSRRTPAP